MLGLLLGAAPPPIQIDYEEFAGLQIRVNGIHLVQGSAFQYYEDGWKRGIYSSNWRPKLIERLPNSRIRVRFEGDDGRVTGTHVYSKSATGVKAEYEFRWRGEKPVRLENSFALIWGPSVENGSLLIDGREGLGMSRPLPAKAPIWEKQFGPSGKQFLFDSPFARIQVDISQPGSILFDARGHNQDWADNRELFWLGAIDQRINPQQTIRWDVNWNIDVKDASLAPAVKTSTLEASGLAQALSPSDRPLPLIPQPKQLEQQAGPGVPLDPAAKFELAPRHAHLEKEFWDSLWTRWQKASVSKSMGDTVIVGRVEAQGLRAEGYRIKAEGSRIEVIGQDDAGLRHGLRSLVWLVRARSGRLEVPRLAITDWPSLSWRGIHTFVGPTALGFQTRLMDRLLAPLKFNRVVVQGERTAWKSLPGIETPITMSREDHRELYARYRARGFEPIPLIQSLGHTYWIFANGQNLDIAVNPQEPFTLDPRRERTRQVLSDLWKEAIDLLQPKTIHFGLDEIDMRGIPDDKNFTTRLWTRHVPWLMDLAERNKVTPMMWGDIMLGPGEAPDAAHAKSVEAAKERRAVVRKGTLIADWHYKDDPRPDIWNSLDVFQKAGFAPIASTWFRPNNIRGFALGAIKAGAPGLLQTTWAGYESSEPNMIRAFEQFSAYVLAADYAWSGREELPDKLPYNPQEVLTRLYFNPAEPVSPAGGDSLFPAGRQPGESMRIGPIAFRRIAPLRLHTPIDGEGQAAPHELVFQLNNRASEAVLAVDAAGWVADNEPLAEAVVKLADGAEIKASILYGQHARAPRDPRPSLISPRQNRLSAFRIDLQEAGDGRRIVEIRLRRLSAAGGLRLHGITLVKPREEAR